MDKVILWLMKRLILLWDRHGDKMAHQFENDNHTSYALLVERFYDGYFTFGTATMYPHQYKTNGDWIKGMTNNELAQWLWSVADGAGYNYKEWLDWLEQEKEQSADGETNG